MNYIMGRSELRRLPGHLLSLGIALFSAVILLGWTFGSRHWIRFVPGTVPMHPLTATLFGVAAVTLFFIGGRPTPLKQKLGVLGAVLILCVGIVQTLGYGLGSGPTLDHFFFNDSVHRIATEFAPQRIQLAPNTAINFALIGAAMCIIHSRWRRCRWLAMALALTSMLLALLTLSGHFIHVASLSSFIRNLPMSHSTATGFLLLGTGVIAELFNAGEVTGEVIDRTTAKPIRIVGLYFNDRAQWGFGSALLLLLGIGIVSYRSISQLDTDSQWVDHTHQVLAALQTMDMEVKEAESNARGYVITKESEYLARWETAVGALGSKVEAIKSLSADNAIQQQHIKDLKPLIERKIGVMRDLLQLTKEQGAPVGHQAKLIGEGHALMDVIHRGIGEMEAEENARLKERAAETELSTSRSTRLIESGALLTLVLMISGGWMIRRDIVRQSRAELALRASEMMFRGLLESAPDAMVIVNEIGRIELINVQAEQMFGYTATEIHGKSIETIIPEGYLAQHVAQRNSYSSIAAGPGTRMELKLSALRKDTKTFPVEISLGSLCTPGGLRISSAIRDVTLRRQEEEALKTLNAALQVRTSELEAANKELESFSYSVSHDLRAPLRSIDGFSQALLEDNGDNLDGESRDNLRRVRAASQRMGHLIDDLLNLARVTRAQMTREPVDLSVIARTTIKELQETTPERKVEVVIADGLTAEADPRLIQIMLFNLLSNAWKFTGKCAQPHIEFGCSSNEGVNEYFVRDNGAGFDMAHASKLFGAFQRLHGMAEFPGTGVGLATVQRIARRHGGRVWAKSEVGAGATFYFSFSSPAHDILAGRALARIQQEDRLSAA